MGKKYFYGIEFKCGKNTTTGWPNEKTGNMSIACNLKIFDTKLARDNWADGCRKIAVNKSEIRDYHLGMSMQDYNEYLEFEIAHYGCI